jgi:hypothetical protein
MENKKNKVCDECGLIHDEENEKMSIVCCDNCNKEMTLYDYNHNKGLCNVCIDNIN